MPVPLIEDLYPTIFSQPSAAIWLTLALVSVAANLLLGRWLSSPLFSVSTYLGQLNKALINKLDRHSRTPGTLRIRGFILTIVFMPALFYAGLLINQLLPYGVYGDIVALAMLVPLIRLWPALHGLISAGKSLGAKTKGAEEKDRFKTARASLATAILTVTTTLLPYIICFSLAGFALLLPFVWLQNLLSHAERERNGSPESPFFCSAHILHELIAAPSAILGAIIMAFAHFFMLGTNLHVFRAFHPGATFGPASRYFPLKVIAEGLGLSVEADIGCETEKKKAFDRNPKWIGAAEGKAMVQPADLRKSWFILIISLALLFVVAVMVLAALLLV
jgi:hypothetical protein